jgi:hypothetical protein
MKKKFYAIVSGELKQDITDWNVSFSIKGNWWINKPIEEQIKERLKWLHPSCELINFDVLKID